MNIRRIVALVMVLVLTLAIGVCALAESAETTEAETVEVVATQDNTKTAKAYAAAALMAIACAAGAIGMASAIMKASEGISRQPEAQEAIRTTLMLGLVFIETAIIYALIIGILIIFVL